ncbi:MAG: hypothetical protein DMG43_09745 [Acidobacteria bacterium]|nr:MAG: hypothetical protein DMG43_09745 [Acidobacteriota bacterium]
MSYEWDPAKARANLAKHGIRFADAIAVLEHERALTIRDPFSEHEERWITLGSDAMGRVLVVVYSWRGGNARLISARRATRRERKQYEGTYDA